jgi:hypothetical protein
MVTSVSSLGFKASTEGIPGVPRVNSFSLALELPPVSLFQPYRLLISNAKCGCSPLPSLVLLKTFVLLLAVLVKMPENQLARH